MRRYRTTSWILLILSIINVTLGAPIAGRDINGVRANGVDVDKDMTAALQKRMDSDDDRSSDLTSEHGSPSGYAIPELEQESESESESESGSESESEPESGSDDSGGGEVGEWDDEVFQNWSDISDEEAHEENNQEQDDQEQDDHGQSPPHDPEHDEIIPHNLESQDPVAADLWSKILKDSFVHRRQAEVRGLMAGPPPPPHFYTIPRATAKSVDA